MILFFYASLGTIVPFFNLVFRSKGLGLEKIGLLMLIPRILSLFSSMLWAGIADNFHLQKKIIPIAMFSALPFVTVVFLADEFQNILIFYCLYSFCFSPLVSLTDNAVLNIVGNKNDYGKIRVWGSLSWGISAWLTGMLTDQLGMNAILWVFMILMTFAIFFAWKLPEVPIVKHEPYLQNIRVIVKDRKWIVFILISILSGYGLMATVSYLPLYLQDLGASTNLIGLASTVCTLSEIPIFLLSPMLLRRFDKMKIIQVSLIGLIIRCSLYTLIQTPSPAVFIQLLHSISYALFNAVAVSYVREISPSGFSASGQALYKTMLAKVGGVLGALGGSFFYENYGPKVLFLSAALGALTAYILLLVDSRTKKVEEFQASGI